MGRRTSLKLPGRLARLVRGTAGQTLESESPSDSVESAPAPATNPLVIEGGPILALRGITKRFPEVLANDNIDLDIHGGEVQALLGENGAGKSTLMKILYGFYRPDSGQILHHGQPVTIQSPQDSRRLQIGMVFQSFTLVPAMSVAENIALFLPDLKALLNHREIIRRIEEVSQRYGLQVDPKTPTWQLSIGERQKVEVLKLLLAEARVLIFDEPTSVLAPHEADALFQVFDKLRSDGFSVLFITHKLREVLATADRVTVLRRGSVVGTIPREGATEAALVDMMFGTAPPEARSPVTNAPSEEVMPILELREVSTDSAQRDVNIQSISMQIRPGEVLVVAGVSGSGQRELGEAILGMEPCSKGKKLVDGQDATHWSVADYRKHGVSYIPEDPGLYGVIQGMTVQENMPLCDRTEYSQFGGVSMDWKAIKVETERSLKNFGLQIPPLDSYVETLSGGNMQRVVLARELSRDPKLIIAFHPTRGLDVPSAVATRDLLTGMRDSGSGILLISEDLNELFSLSDRLIVMFQGRIVGEVKPQETTMRDVGHLMTGGEAA